MSNLEDSFLQGIARQPHDWLPRLIYADWLEEQGEPRGELIRLSYQLTRLDCEQRQQKEARRQELSAAGVVWPSPSLPNSLNLQLVLIPPGEFRMGSPESESNRDFDEAQVNVTLTQGFWLGRYQVTQAEWEAIMGTKPWKRYTYGNTQEGRSYPATHARWDEASEFCVKLTEKGHCEDWLPKYWGFDLPTEAQWEYACRAGTQSPYFFGEDESLLGQYAWFRTHAFDVSEWRVHPVGQKKPNCWNLSDMQGNVAEWCRDWYGLELPGGTDPDEREGSWHRVIRGGRYDTTGARCRSASRESCIPENCVNFLGFRVTLVQTR